MFILQICRLCSKASLFRKFKSGLLPKNGWEKIAPIKTWGGFDIDYEWQMPLLKHRLKLK